MNQYEAIMAAAEHVENNPTLFNYESLRIPGKNCGSPACAIGWIAFFRGVRERSQGLNKRAQEALGINYWDVDDDGNAFEPRMDAIDEDWRKPTHVVRALRLYAKKYYFQALARLADGEGRGRADSGRCKRLVRGVVNERY